MAWNTVEVEPIHRGANVSKNMPALPADFKRNGIWKAERLASYVNQDQYQYTLAIYIRKSSHPKARLLKI